MNRYSNLFAIAAIVLFAVGLVIDQRWSNLFLSFHLSQTGYAVSPKVLLFAVAVAFALSALLYSVLLLPLRNGLATWHFAVSAAAAVTLVVALFGMNNSELGHETRLIVAFVGLFISISLCCWLRGCLSRTS
jgi:hypothetical protein